jgi:hypothetical protein
MRFVPHRLLRLQRIKGKRRAGGGLRAADGLENSLQLDNRLLGMYHRCQVLLTLGQAKLLLGDRVLGDGLPSFRYRPDRPGVISRTELFRQCHIKTLLIVPTQSSSSVGCGEERTASFAA